MATTLPETGAYSSETALTDSTVPKLVPFCTCAPILGSSTKTMSPSDSCAWSVIPTVPVFPWICIHSCSLVYLQSLGYAILCLCPCLRGLCFLGSFVKRSRHDLAFHSLAADLHENFVADFRLCGWNIRQGNALLQKWSIRSASDVTDLAAVAVKNLVVIPWNAAVHRFHADQDFLYPFSLGFLQGSASDEVLLFHLAIAFERRFPAIDGV